MSTKLDANQVIKSVYDESSGAFKTIPASATSFSIELDATDGDSIETRKMAIDTTTLLNAVSGGSNVTSSPIDVLKYSCAAFVVSFSGVGGGLDGVISYQYSLDNTVWLDSGEVTNINAASGNSLKILNPLPVKHVRLNYTANTTTGGTITVKYIVKS